MLKRYERFRIIATTQTYNGDIVDWIDPATVPGADAEPPPPSVREDMPAGTERAKFELEVYPEYRLIDVLSERTQHSLPRINAFDHYRSDST